jgi:hypothetical protein
MTAIYIGRDPQISKDYNGKSIVIIVPLAASKSNPITLPDQPIQMTMDSPEYAEWHRQHVVIPTLMSKKKNSFL